MKKNREGAMKLQTRLMINFISLIIIITLFTDTITYFRNVDSAMKELDKKVCDMSASAALLIDGDMIKAVQSSNDMKSPEYITIRDKLIEFQKVTGVTCIYTLAEDGKNKTKFIIDGTLDDPSALGESYDYFDGMLGAFSGTPTANRDLYTDKWGTYLSGYAPIKDSSGNIVAILAVDISAQQVSELKLGLFRDSSIKLIITILLFIIMTLIICRRIIKPIHLLDLKLKELSTSGGDLTKTIEIHTGDEIESLANSVNDFIANIRCIISKAALTSEQVNSSASQLETSIVQTVTVLENNTSAIQMIASGAMKQGRDIDTVTHGIVGIGSEVTESNANIDLINNTITNTERHIINGIHIIKNLNVNSEGNIKAFGEVNQKISDLVTDVKNISDILQSITNISEQINLLALNSSIEAARAGVYGKGFSVVASEIKQLAANTARSVQEVNTILSRVNEDTEIVNSQINVVNDTILKQMDSVTETENTFHGIQENVNHLISGISQINQAFAGVGTSINDISSSMTTICEISQENAAVTEELSASSEEQSAIMHEIEDTVKNLRIQCEDLDNTIIKFTL